MGDLSGMSRTIIIKHWRSGYIYLPGENAWKGKHRWSLDYPFKLKHDDA